VEKLSQQTIDQKLEKTDDWTENNDSIQRTFQFNGFNESMDFVNKVASHAEEVQHHPDILIRFNKVTLTLSTHDAGGITDKDFEFAKFADSVS